MGRDDEKRIIHKKLDGELNKHETKAFQKKIKTDPAIRVEYESLRKVTETSEKIVKPILPPPDFKSRIIRKVADEPENS